MTTVTEAEAIQQVRERLAERVNGLQGLPSNAWCASTLIICGGALCAWFLEHYCLVYTHEAQRYRLPTYDPHAAVFSAFRHSALPEVILHQAIDAIDNAHRRRAQILFGAVDQPETRTVWVSREIWERYTFSPKRRAK